MRTTFIDTMLKMAEKDERIFLITADLGWSVLERYANQFPERFLNVGVAEQNMLSVAAGLAREGYIPFVYSIATFASMRGYEQFRDGAVLHHLPVRVIGIGGGFSYGHAGPTHHALEDLCIMRCQPGVRTYAPVDSTQLIDIMNELNSYYDPAYIRVDKTNWPDLPGLNRAPNLSLPSYIYNAGDILIIATGSIAHEAYLAVEQLRSDQHQIAFAVMGYLPHEADEMLANQLSKFKGIISVEEGYTVGGLGSLVAEALTQTNNITILSKLGVKKSFIESTGSTDFMREQHQLRASHIISSFHALAQRINA